MLQAKVIWHQPRSFSPQELKVLAEPNVGFFEWTKRLKGFDFITCQGEISSQLTSFLKNELSWNHVDSAAVVRYRQRRPGFFARDDRKSDLDAVKELELKTVLKEANVKGARKQKEFKDVEQNVQSLLSHSLSSSALYIYDVDLTKLLNDGVPLSSENAVIDLWAYNNPLSFHCFGKGSEDPWTGFRTPGLNFPQIFVGTPFSTSPIHQEQFGVYSVLHHVYGSDKVWILVDERDYHKFMEVAKDYTKNRCNNCLSPKCYMFDVDFLLEKGIRLHGFVQKPGTYVFVPGRQFHFCVNTGYNVSVTMNFAPFWFFKEGHGFDDPVPECEHKIHNDFRLLRFNREKLKLDFEDRVGIRGSSIDPRLSAEAFPIPPFKPLINPGSTALFVPAPVAACKRHFDIGNTEPEKKKVCHQSIQCPDTNAAEMSLASSYSGSKEHDMISGYCRVCRFWVTDIFEHIAVNHQQTARFKCRFSSCTYSSYKRFNFDRHVATIHGADKS